MPSAFLLNFSRPLVRRLVEAEALELSGPEDAVAFFVAEWLGGVKPHSSLVSSLVDALCACPQVEELYADDEDLKRLLEDLGPAWRTG